MRTKQLINDLTTAILADRAGCLEDPGDAILSALKASGTPDEIAKIREALTLRSQPKHAAKAPSTGRTRSDVPNQANLPKHDPTRQQFEAVLGPYGTEAEAKQEVSQFRHPNVFAYRSAMFPTPQNFGITAEVTAAEVVRVENPNPLYPFGVQLQLTVTGARAQAWITAFKNRARLFNVKKA